MRGAQRFARWARGSAKWGRVPVGGVENGREREILWGVRWIIQGGQMNFVKRKNDFFILAGAKIGIFI